MYYELCKNIKIDKLWWFRKLHNQKNSFVIFEQPKIQGIVFGYEIAQEGRTICYIYTSLKKLQIFYNRIIHFLNYSSHRTPCSYYVVQ
jgi:hypothetical protein